MRWRIALVATIATAALWATNATAKYQFLGDVTAVERQESGVVLHCGAEQVRIGFLSPEIVRVRVAWDGKWEEHPQYAISKAEWPGAQLDFAETNGQIILKTGALELRIDRKPCRLAFYDAQDNLLNEDDKGFGMARDGNEVAVFKRLLGNERFLGLGEKGGNLDHRGREVEMWNSDTPFYDDRTDPLYQSHPFYLAIRAGRAHGVFFNNTYRSHFNMGAGNHRLYSFRAEGGPLDYFVFAGPSPKDVLSRYATLVGKMPLPPLWSLGYQQCRWSYYPESEVRRLARTFREKQIPADVIYLDIHYMDGYRCFTFDKSRFPHPAKMMSDLKADGFKLVTIVDPGIKVDSGYRVYDEGLAGNHFIKYPDGQLYTGDVWPGRSCFTDYTREDSRRWWGDLVGEFVDTGVAGIWNDMNEPAVWGKEAPLLVEFGVQGNTTNLKEIHNVFAHLMAEATYEGLRRKRPNERPFILTRAGFSGTQRFAASWTGDNSATFEDMETAIRICESMGASAIPFVGADVGGFFESPSPELMARWVQLGAFTPFFRTHSVANSPDQEPWSFGEEVEAINRKYIQLRYRLLPYTYSAFAQAAATGVPIMRSLVLEYPSDYNVLRKENQTNFLWGDAILVAPVTREGERVKKVYLPAGRWFDFWENQSYEGGQSYFIETPLSKLPLFVRAGSVIAMRDVQQFVGEKPLRELTVHVFPGEQCTSTLYEDDGHSFAYETGQWCRTNFTVSGEDEQWSLKIAKREGEYNPQKRNFNIVLHGLDAVPKLVRWDGRDLTSDELRYDSPAGTAQLTLSDDGKEHELTW